MTPATTILAASEAPGGSVPETVATLAGDAGLDAGYIWQLARQMLAEDLQWGPDVTTAATIDPAQTGTADIIARADGTIAGIPVAQAIAYAAAIDHGVTVCLWPSVSDGARVRRGDIVLTLQGPLQVLLTAERSMLNVLSQLSGVATRTAAWVDAVGNSHCRIRDTRKTVPGLRVLQKYAVAAGGGQNHRMGLGDAALIKDNHVAAAGSITAAFQAVRRHHATIAVEVECDTIDQVRQARAAGADLILADNMTGAELSAAVAICRGHDVRVEASGGLELSQAAEIAATGVDYIAVGEPTHSAPVLDLGLDLRS